MNNTLHYSSPKLSVKDSFDDDEVSDDVEDEVFIRDGKNGFKLDDEIGVKRPLMAPRRKFKYNQLNADRCKRPIHKRICFPYSYGVSFLSVFLGLTIALIVILCVFPNPIDKFRHWKMDEIKVPTIVPPTQFKPEHIWHQTFPFLKSESVMTSFDANGDTVLDVVLGFATGIAESEVSERCALYDVSDGKCGGGVIALDGRTGSVLWKYWTRKDVLYLECSQNVNSDKTPDCLVSGRGGVLCVLDGKTGFIVWEFSKSPLHHRMDLYTAQYIFDLNDDGYADILISHTSDQSSHIVILNGRNGEEIGQIESPNKRGIFTPPRVLHTRNNTYNVIFGTGEIGRAGAVYMIPLDSVALSDLTKCITIWEGPHGLSSDILLADINADLTPDIIFASGHIVSVISGTDYSSLWNVSSNNSPSQILIDPTPAYFDDDMFPDLLITEMIGNDYPGYYSRSWVASGKTGKPLLSEGMLGTGELTAPGITLSFSGIGNDMFLYWSTSCNVPDHLQQQPFAFAQGTTAHEKTHADLCKLRFNSTLETRLYVLSQHIEPPGVLLYSSKNEWDIEHNNTVGSYFSARMDEQKLSTNKGSSSFRHKGGLHPYYQVNAETTQKKSSFGNFQMFGEGKAEKNRWQQPQISYDDRLPMLPSVTLGELADAYYPQEMPSPELSGSLDEGRDERANYPREMMKRHVARQPSIIPRALSTATLVNAVNGTSIDVVFATFWEMATTKVRVFTAKEQKCIERKVEAEKNSNNLNFLDVELARESAERECGGEAGEDWGGLEDLPAGQLTIFRLSLGPSCSELRPGELCSSLLPHSSQSYPRRSTDVVYNNRPQTFTHFYTS